MCLGMDNDKAKELDSRACNYLLNMDMMQCLRLLGGTVETKTVSALAILTTGCYRSSAVVAYSHGRMIAEHLIRASFSILSTMTKLRRCSRLR